MSRWSKILSDPAFKEMKNNPAVRIPQAKKTSVPQKKTIPSESFVLSQKAEDEIRSMFYDLMFGFGAGNLTGKEVVIVKQLHQQFEGSSKISPAQKSLLASFWIKYQYEEAQ